MSFGHLIRVKQIGAGPKKMTTRERPTYMIRNSDMEKAVDDDNKCERCLHTLCICFSDEFCLGLIYDSQQPKI